MQQLPPLFEQQMESLGLSDVASAISAGPPEVSVRLSRAKPAPDFEGAEPVAWCGRGLYLPSRPSFTLDPCFHQGRYYVQEAASMFHARVARHLCTLSGGLPLRVLDACAAPGGKTTAVIDELPEGSLTVANEYVPARAAVLRENIVKWGAPGVIVTRGDTAALSRLKEAFDIVIADVPCSGEGMMRKDAEAVSQWSEGLVEECAGRQREIVDNLWRALAPGGYMVYSTCTFNRRENEEMVEYIISELGGESVEIPVEESWNISPGLFTTAACYRFLPGRTRGEGLFVSVIRKDGEPSARKDRSRGRDKKKQKPVPPAAAAAIAEATGWIYASAGMRVTLSGDRVTAFPEAHASLLKALEAETDVIHEGVTLATLKGRDIVPAHSLAMSSLLKRGVFPEVELSREDSLRYLHGDAPTLPEETPRGYVLLTFLDLPLGWVKNLGRRCNSLYPQSWRIRLNIE